MKPRGKQFYDGLKNQIYNVMALKYPEMDFTKAGSREKGNFRRKSDQDARFWINGDPPRDIFYLNLMEYLKKKLPDYNGERLNYKIGEEGNVLKVLPANGGKIDLVLLSKADYDRQEG